jgi:hypothetical protein
MFKFINIWKRAKQAESDLTALQESFSEKCKEINEVHQQALHFAAAIGLQNNGTYLLEHKFIDILKEKNHNITIEITDNGLLIKVTEELFANE